MKFLKSKSMLVLLIGVGVGIVTAMRDERWPTHYLYPIEGLVGALIIIWFARITNGD